MMMQRRNVMRARSGAKLLFWGGVACLSVVFSPGCGEATSDTAPKPADATASTGQFKELIKVPKNAGKKGKAKADSSTRQQHQKTVGGSAEN